MAQQPGLRLAEALTALALDHGALASRAIRAFHRAVLANGPRPIRLIGLASTGHHPNRSDGTL